MTMTLESSRKPTLRDRAQLLQELLNDDGISVTLEEAETLILADLVERIKVKTS